MRLDYKEKFNVTMEIKDDLILGHHLLETWRNSKGEICRPGDLPSLVAYDAETGQRICRGWPDKDGVFRQRDGGTQPSMISEVPGETAYAYWYDTIGNSIFISRAIDEIRHPVTGEYLGHVFGEPEPCQSEYKHLPVPSVDF